MAAARAGQVPASLAAAYQEADERVLAKIRVALGLDQVRMAFCGAAPIAPEILGFMHALGIPVAEVWGMSECLVGTANSPGAIRLGTVGPAVPGTEVKLASDGEALLPGPTAMRGYHHDPAGTDAAIDAGGWLHTGDLAAIGADGYVRISGRAPAPQLPRDQPASPAKGRAQMTAEDNIKLVQQQFEAFSHGDVDVALAAVADQVDWQAPVSAHGNLLPWAGRRRGRQQVADYFRDLTSAVRPQPFQDLTFTAAGDRVVVEGHNRGTVVATGQPYEHEWVMVFTIRSGQVVRFRHYYDPADIASAFG